MKTNLVSVSGFGAYADVETITCPQGTFANGDNTGQVWCEDAAGNKVQATLAAAGGPGIGVIGWCAIAAAAILGGAWIYASGGTYRNNPRRSYKFFVKSKTLTYDGSPLVLGIYKTEAGAKARVKREGGRAKIVHYPGPGPGAARRRKRRAKRRRRR